MSGRSKRYTSEFEKTGTEAVGLSEAVERVKSFKSVKFDQSIECVMNLGIDPKQADQLVRGSISLPHGIGKQKKVIAFCEDSDIEAAIAAGAIEAVHFEITCPDSQTRLGRTWIIHVSLDLRMLGIDTQPKTDVRRSFYDCTLETIPLRKGVEHDMIA